MKYELIRCAWVTQSPSDPRWLLSGVGWRGDDFQVIPEAYEAVQRLSHELQEAPPKDLVYDFVDWPCQAESRTRVLSVIEYTEGFARMCDLRHGESVLGRNIVAVVGLTPLCGPSCDWCEELRARCQTRRLA